jgi:hypothetical protein
METVQEKNECCKDFTNIEFIRTEKVSDQFTKTVYCCKICNNTYYGRLTEITADSQSFQVIDELNKKGFSLDTLILSGKSAIKFLIPDMSKLIEKTREIAKSKNIQCESHNIKDIFVDENGIFCKNCGKELVLVPAWIIGQQKNTFKEGD